MIFWIIALLMMAIALLFLLPPLLRKSETLVDDRRELNIDIAKQQLQELETELKDGNIEEDAYKSAKDELEQSLYSDLEGTGKSATISADTHKVEAKWGILFVGLFVPALAAGLYTTIGKQSAIPESSVDRSKDPRNMTREQQLGSIEEMLGKLEVKLEKEPKNTEGWIMLGRSYQALNRFDDAAKAYTKANELEPENAQIMLSLADTIATAKDGDLKGKPEALILKALEKEPKSIMGLWLAGMAAKQRGVNADAAKYWETLEPLLDPASGDRKEVRALITEVGGKLADIPAAKSPSPASVVARSATNAGSNVAAASAPSAPAKPVIGSAPVAPMAPSPNAAAPIAVAKPIPEVTPSTSAPVAAAKTTPGAAPVPATTDKAVTKGVTVMISLSDELKAKAKPEDTVFIYAKAMAGPPMPLAAQRKQVKDLPLTIVLDDSTAMMPQMKLSNFAEVKVGARVSFTGQPTAQPGDLFTEKASVKAGETIKLVIDSVVGN